MDCNDLRTKMAELMTVPDTYDNVKILCVTETMFDNDILDAEISIPNFKKFFRNDRCSGKEGVDLASMCMILFMQQKLIHLYAMIH